MTRAELLTAYKTGKISTEALRDALKKLKNETTETPLSEGQKGLWMLQKISPTMSAYNVPICFRVAQNLDRQAFEKACRFLVEQYPILNTEIVEKKGQLFQKSTPSRPIDLRWATIESEDWEEWKTTLKKEAKTPFQIERDSLFRVRVFTTATKAETIVLITVHHTVFDGSSFPLLIETLLNAYRDFADQKEPKATPTATDYEIFVTWEQDMLQGAEGEEHQNYWKNQLSGGLPTMELPTDRPRFSARNFQGETLTATLPAELSQQIRELARQERVNPSALFLGVFQLLLYRYTEQEEMIIGMPMMVRPQERFDSLIGYLINMLPIRSNGIANAPFREQLRKLELTMVDAQDHGVYPFSRIVKDLNLPRTEAASPLFQVAYAYQNFYQSVDTAIPVDWIEEIRQEGEYEFELEVFEKENTFQLNMKYNPDLFDRSTIQRMMNYYRCLTEAVVENPDLELTQQVPMPNEEKARQIEWNNTIADYRHDLSVCELFQQQAKNNPEAIAVICEENSLTYRELNEKSDTLATYLQKQGVNADDLIGVCLERSLNMVVALLGIMKAGGAYVPLDPTYPADRLEYMINSSQTSLLLTQSNLTDKLATLTKGAIKTIALDRDWPTIEREQQGEEKLQRRSGPENLAYVIYTSGSTGNPKGVMIPHRALTNFLISMGEKPGLTKQDKMLAVTTYCFDIAGLELFLPLIKGAECHICTSDQARDVELLKREIQTKRPTIMQATPATWTMLFHSGWNNEEKVKILCGGEAMPEALKRLFTESNSEVWNMFGPTETTIWSTVQQIKPEENITIGKPIANTRILIVDKFHNPTPISVPGELCIAGDGLARGYWNQPELTAEKFIDDPRNPGEKLYKTGDLARWLPDGNIEFLGRNDHQVKIRGYRIELGEIETQLRDLPNIQECAVVVKERNGSKQLVAWYVSEGTTTPNHRELREALKVNLPDYMVPASFVAVDSMPLTPNGKVDRKTLMARPIKATPSKEEKSTPDNSEIEKEILTIWQTLLETDDINREDGFFDIGGDSILAVTVAERISDRLNCKINATTLFKYGNIRSLAEYLAESKQQTERMPETIEPEQSEAAPKPAQNRTESLPEYYNDSLAIIGISGRFPGANNTDQFWNNLKEGKESVQFFTEQELKAFPLPKEVKEHPGFVPMRSTIEGKELFDADFFSIAPRDAEFMDPQFRLLLLHAWSAVEDAGYIAKQIPETAVYVSTSNSGYQALLPENMVSGTTKVIENSDEYVSWLLAQGGTVPTMISHKLGLKGPSFFVHSNCSSSLVGLHSAFQTIQSGECDYALIGAATVFPASNLGYLHQQGLNFSSDGHCKTFDATADGMIGGEGAAVMVVKNAAKAVRDRDNIYALVRGVALNNDGADKVGFYAPSVKGQSQVIQKVLDTTGINPETIRYVEAHGTGTKLGDPIELEALTDTYRQYTKKRNFCGVGSVKTNIGHLDTAAGLAGCIKIALSFRNRELPPTINYTSPNPNIDFEGSPFFVQNRVTSIQNDSAPCRAAISSFGIGGTNAHAILEQYTPPVTIEKEEQPSQNYRIPLSAKTEEQLREYAQNLLDFLKKNQEKTRLADVAHTLRTGRESMENRVAFLANSTKQLIDLLQQFVNDQNPAEHCYRKENTTDEPDGWIEQWLKGNPVKPQPQHEEAKGFRISLPTYPFANERFPIPSGNKEATTTENTTAVLHPLLHQNTSTLQEQSFSSLFTGKEFFLDDHLVKGERVLPGMGSLEMARAAIYHAMGYAATGEAEERQDIVIKNVAWVQPIAVSSQPLPVRIAVHPEGENRIDYKIYKESPSNESTPHLFSQGQARLRPRKEETEAPLLDLAALKKECRESSFLSDRFYESVREMGVDYGPALQGVSSVYAAPDMLLAKLTLPEVIKETREQFVLHPTLMDSAVQVSLILQTGIDYTTLTEGELSLKITLPFALQEAEIFSDCLPEMWTWIRYAKDNDFNDSIRKVDIDLCDDQGRVCVRMKGFSSRLLDKDPQEVPTLSQKVELPAGTTMLTPKWESEVPEKGTDPTGTMILIGGSEQDRQALSRRYSNLRLWHFDEREPTERIVEKIQQEGSIGHIFRIVSDTPPRSMTDERIIEAQKEGILPLFNLIQAVIRLGYGTKELNWTVLTKGDPTHAGIHGLMGTVVKEYTNWNARLIDIKPDTEWSVEEILTIPANGTGTIRTKKSGEWFRQTLAPHFLSASSQSPWQSEGVYIVIGGAGGIGEVWSESMIRDHQAKIVWIGRREKDETIRAKQERLAQWGQAPLYISADATDRKAMETARDQVKQTFGKINGVIHSAVVLDDRSLANMDEQSLTASLRSKVDLSVRMAQVFEKEPLDFMLFFSSINSLITPPGQANYNAGSLFEDAFAAQLGKEAAWPVKVINWGYWGTVGVVASDEHRQRMEQAGIGSIEPNEASDALESLLSGPENQIVLLKTTAPMTLEGTTFTKSEETTKKAPAITKKPETDTSSTLNDHQLENRVKQMIRQCVAESLRTEPAKIQDDRSFSEMGVDSIIAVNLINQIGKEYNIQLETTVFFDYSNVNQLCDYLLTEQASAIQTRFGSAQPEQKQRKPEAKQPKTVPQKTNRFQRNPQIENRSVTNTTTNRQPIAIIGMSGRFPQSENVEALWNHLANGDDLIEKAFRWDLEKYKTEKNQKSYCDYGGFLQNIDQFDPLFFNISGTEANYMDPRQRLFLEESWKTLEDAGYVAENIKGSRCGVYVGAGAGDYLKLLQENPPAQAFWGNDGSVIPARIAYYLDLQGPAVAVDTACSSSLVAIHFACQALWSGEIELALAGGVYLNCTSDFYAVANQAGMLSPTGRCHTFDQQADGFVPGEGVGAVLLKRLDTAISDGDNIHGVIRGSGINQDGTTNGLTAPSSKSQKRLERDVYETFNINPETIQMVEAHGTGTKLGDPIEFNALTGAFREDTDKTGYCAIGSIKTNLGHTASAAGVAGVIKVLLSLKHKQIPPSIHFHEGNGNIRFENSPFRVNTELKHWETETNKPRRAAISSFGISGTNAHMVIEEAPTIEQEQPEPSAFLITLSAQTENQLKQQAEQLTAHCEQYPAINCADMSHTLLIGRKHQPRRLATVVQNREELIRKLQEWLKAGDQPGVLIGNTNEGNGETRPSLKRYGNQVIESCQQVDDDTTMRENLETIADLYVQGYDLNLAQLFEKGEHRKISLPTYPFAAERYWIPQASEPRNQKQQPKAVETDDFKVMTFREEWMEQPLPENQPISIQKVLCLLSDSKQRQTVRETMKRIDPNLLPVFIGNEELSEKQNPESYTKTLEKIRQEQGTIDTLFYLYPLETTEYRRDFAPIVALLQAMGIVKTGIRKVLLAGPWSNEEERCFADSMIAMERSLELIMPNTRVTTLLGEAEAISTQEWITRLLEATAAEHSQSAMIQGGKRYIRQTVPLTLDRQGDTLLRTQGTYLITGGMGGIGQLVANHLAKTWKANLILTGRSPIEAEKTAILNQLEQSGAKAIYLQADVSDENSMKQALTQAKERFGAIHGVIHAAGLEDPKTLPEKEITRFQQVLAPKVEGTLTLDRLLLQDSPDFVCYFSSTSAILGDFGSCDYAIANRFQLAHGRYRNSQNRKTIVINWPLWKEGGMGFDNRESQEMYLKSSGQRALKTEEGMALLEELLRQNQPECMVLTGDPKRVERFLTPTEAVVAPKSSIETTPSEPKGKGRKEEMKGLTTEECLESDLKSIASELLSIATNRLDSDTNLADFGFDSVSLAEYATLLTEHFELEITPAIFFGHSTLEKLVVYFQTEFQQEMETFYREESTEQQKPIQQTQSILSPHTSEIAGNQESIQSGAEKQIRTPHTSKIAIIGMSGRFPNARNVEEMWTILAEGENAVQEIPTDRFDLRELDSRWSGLIPGVREFDPLFFEISPLEAESMDPRQRLLLQESWNALEDAGYGTKQLNSANIGMFVGVEQGDYQLMVDEENGFHVTSNHNGILAARLAYTLNFSGPNMAINTACSSGLVATHQACLSLRNHECDTAIAAGVNLMLTPVPYVRMGKAGMLSEDGKCYTFDKRANGMVPGEAIAVVVLKRLSDTVNDQDPIYATIRGTGINYDGKTNGITAPSGVSQTNLLNTIYEREKINPENIEYIVTHGTGTKLGDPVEINALADAFGKSTEKQAYCALTSTKTNFGHTFAASGVVSLISLVQAMRYETIPASLHCEEENPFIIWKNSPFYVNKSNRPWPKNQEKPRLGALSSFGISGTNAHMVVEEYLEPNEEQTETCAPYSLLTLSAKTEQALTERVRLFIDHFQRQPVDDRYIDSVGYTLLEGRQHFKHRCAIVVENGNDAIQAWNRMEQGEKSPNLFRGRITKEFTSQKVTKQYGEQLLEQIRTLKENKTEYRETLYALADLYCQGYDLRWAKLYEEAAPKRLHLPTYPFAKTEYWVPETATADKQEQNNRATANDIHPLLHRNISDSANPCFSSDFTGQEFFLKDHIVGNEKVLPGVAYTEMALEAIKHSMDVKENERVTLKNIVWLRPFTIEQGTESLRVDLNRDSNGEISWKISGTNLHCQGNATIQKKPTPLALDPIALQTEHDHETIDAENCYKAFNMMNIQYGPAYRGIQQIHKAEYFALVKLSMPTDLIDSAERFTLHPSMMDSALQGVIGLLVDDWGHLASDSNKDHKPVLPFALGEVEIHDRCVPEMWALIRHSEDTTTEADSQKMDLDLCDEQGRILVRLKGFASRTLEREITETTPAKKPETETKLLMPLWDIAPVEWNELNPASTDRILIVKNSAENEQEAQKIRELYPDSLLLETEPNDTIETITQKLNLSETIDHIIWLSPNRSPYQAVEERLIEEQNRTVLTCFRLIKALLRTGYDSNKLSWTVITVQTQPVRKEEHLNSADAAIHGLIGSMAKEFPNWTVRMVDLEAGQEWPVESIFTLNPDPLGNAWGYRDNQWYRQQLMTVQFPPMEQTKYRQGGVYVVIGGAGGIGEVWSEYMIRTWNAKIIWIGRREQDETIQNKQHRLEQVGTAPWYIQADATNQESLRQALETIKERHPQIHGVVHSALVLSDQSLINMDEQRFRSGLSAKVDVSVRMAQVFQQEPLDFVLFFSSTMAFAKAPGQSNYASGCAFKDSFALQLAAEWPCAVKVMNWGYWGSVGIVASKEYQDRMTRQGIGSIEPPEAMEALETLLTGPITQMALMKTIV